MALVYGLVAIQEEDWRWLFLPRSEPASEIKNSGIRYVNEVFQGSDDYGHHRKNLRYFDNGSELPSGQIIGKAISDCQNRCRIIWLNKLGSCDNGVIVSKELFDQLKVGDQIKVVLLQGEAYRGDKSVFHLLRRIGFSNLKKVVPWGSKEIEPLHPTPILVPIL